MSAGNISDDGSGCTNFIHPVGDSDDVATVMEAARKLGVLDAKDWISPGVKSGVALVLHTRYTRGGSVEFARVGDCERYLYENPTIYADLRARVLDYLMVNGEGILDAKAETKSAAAEATSL